MADLEQLGSRILDVWSIMLKFKLITMFYLVKSGNRNKKSLTELP